MGFPIQLYVGLVSISLSLGCSGRATFRGYFLKPRAFPVGLSVSLTSSERNSRPRALLIEV